MRSRQVSIPGLAAATLLCLIATAIAMTDGERLARLGLSLFAVSWLVFVASVVLPGRQGSRSIRED